MRNWKKVSGYLSAEDERISVFVPEEELEVKIDRFLLPWCS
jgi:hypothetical protein